MAKDEKWRKAIFSLFTIGKTAINAVFCIWKTSFPAAGLFFVIAGKSTEELAMATLLNDSKHYSG